MENIAFTPCPYKGNLNNSKRLEMVRLKIDHIIKLAKKHHYIY